MKIATLALSAALLAVPGLATAQAQTQQATVNKSDYREIDDLHIIDAQGNKVGEIENTVIDRNGDIAYIVEFDEGFLGMRDHEVVVSADRLSFDAEKHTFTTDLAESDLKALPEWND